jgi:hypothetical protein
MTFYANRSPFAATILVGTKLQCNIGFGQIMTGEVIALAPGRLIVEAENTLYAVNSTTMRDKDGDVWTRVEPSVTEWFNVYDDLTVGSTAHKSFEAAVAASKYGKTRVGIMERTRQGSKIVGCKVHSTTPQRRSAGNTRGVNPYA